ncbi:MAG: hypothetical protein JW769_01120 [Parachlamydiales bacterium]|nr:hypothetical protein [Parachlamydiales bacterium]
MTSNNYDILLNESILNRRLEVREKSREKEEKNQKVNPLLLLMLSLINTSNQLQNKSGHQLDVSDDICQEYQGKLDELDDLQNQLKTMESEKPSSLDAMEDFTRRLDVLRQQIQEKQTDASQVMGKLSAEWQVDINATNKVNQSSIQLGDKLMELFLSGSMPRRKS